MLGQILMKLKKVLFMKAEYQEIVEEIAWRAIMTDPTLTYNDWVSDAFESENEFIKFYDDLNEKVNGKFYDEISSKFSSSGNVKDMHEKSKTKTLNEFKTTFLNRLNKL